LDSGTGRGQGGDRAGTGRGQGGDRAGTGRGQDRDRAGTGQGQGRDRAGTGQGQGGDRTGTGQGQGRDRTGTGGPCGKACPAPRSACPHPGQRSWLPTMPIAFRALRNFAPSGTPFALSSPRTVRTGGQAMETP